MSEPNKVAIITGAGSGIGKACAIRFAKAGMRVALTDINSQALQDTANQLESEGHEVLHFVHDVANEEAALEVAKQVLASWGQIDVLVANAGVQIGGRLLDTKDSDWERILSVNLKGVAYCCKAVIPPMCSQNSGALVLVSSINALVGSAEMAIYDMSKAGVLALVRSLAVEYGTQGIRANAVCPGNTLTEFHLEKMTEKGFSMEEIKEMTKDYGLLGRVAQAEEIANSIYFLASEQSSFITGHSLVVDGGFSVTGRIS